MAKINITALNHYNQSRLIVAQVNGSPPYGGWKPGDRFKLLREAVEHRRKGSHFASNWKMSKIIEFRFI